MAKKLFDLSENLSEENLVKAQDISAKDIAVIGMGLNMPLAEDIDKFWDNLMKGVDCIHDLPSDRKEKISRMIDNNIFGLQGCSTFPAGYIDGVDEFDYTFFKLTPHEASLMDPHQRLFLQTAWQTFEDAGYSGEKLAGTKTGVYVGFNSWSYYQHMIWLLDKQSIALSMAGNLPSVIAGRISYILDLKGPAMIIDTACSSSLVSIHLACRAIRSGECEQALAGGVHVNLLPVESGVKLGIESTDYRARTFDENSTGTGQGEGVAAVLLKPLSRAITDGDNIYAVIKGSSVNQDGRSIGLTAPNAEAQEEVIKAAWLDSGINPETLSYIECHGTGTKLFLSVPKAMACWHSAPLLI